MLLCNTIFIQYTNRNNVYSNRILRKLYSYKMILNKIMYANTFFIHVTLYNFMFNILYNNRCRTLLCYSNWRFKVHIFRTSNSFIIRS